VTGEQTHLFLGHHVVPEGANATDLDLHLGIIRLTPQESPPVDDGCDPDCIVCEPIQHTVTADDDFPIAKRREFWHNTTTLGERCEALGGCQQSLNQRFGGAWRVPRDEVVDVP
jgi:hypothetical protein